MKEESGKEGNGTECSAAEEERIKLPDIKHIAGHLHELPEATLGYICTLNYYTKIISYCES